MRDASGWELMKCHAYNIRKMRAESNYIAVISVLSGYVINTIWIRNKYYLDFYSHPYIPVSHFGPLQLVWDFCLWCPGCQRLGSLIDIVNQTKHLTRPDTSSKLFFRRIPTFLLFSWQSLRVPAYIWSYHVPGTVH